MNSKYQNGKIYCIWSYETDEIYIGSTCDELDHRLKGHRDKYKQFLNGKKNCNQVSNKILKYGDAQIGIIEEYPCNTKQELLRREGELQQQIKCVNKLIAGQTDKEWRILHKTDLLDYGKKYQKKNREKLLQKYNCNCGGRYVYKNKSTHFKTKQHIKWLEENKKLITDNIEDGEEKKE